MSLEYQEYGHWNRIRLSIMATCPLYKRTRSKAGAKYEVMTMQDAGIGLPYALGFGFEMVHEIGTLRLS